MHDQYRARIAYLLTDTMFLHDAEDFLISLWLARQQKWLLDNHAGYVSPGVTHFCKQGCCGCQAPVHTSSQDSRVAEQHL